MLQLLAHLFGDFVFQSGWMAENKEKRSWPAVVHALVYSLCFIPLLWFSGLRCYQNVSDSCTHIGYFRWLPWLVIFGTHFLIDRFRLARYVVWGKNWLAPWFVPVDIKVSLAVAHVAPTRHWRFQRPVPPLAECPNGFPTSVPLWLSTWLKIVVDNSLHLAINYVALTYL